MVRFDTALHAKLLKDKRGSVREGSAAASDGQVIWFEHATLSLY